MLQTESHFCLFAIVPWVIRNQFKKKAIIINITSPTIVLDEYTRELYLYMNKNNWNGINVKVYMLS